MVSIRSHAVGRVQKYCCCCSWLSLIHSSLTPEIYDHVLWMSLKPLPGYLPSPSECQLARSTPLLWPPVEKALIVIDFTFSPPPASHSTFKFCFFHRWIWLIAWIPGLLAGQAQWRMSNSPNFHKYGEHWILWSPCRVDKKLFCSRRDPRISGMDALERIPLFKSVIGLEVPSGERCHNDTTLLHNSTCRKTLPA